jgi:AraC-like DNA-binding protein
MSTINLVLIILFSSSFFNGLFLSLNKTSSIYKNKFLGVTLMLYSLFLLSYVWWFEEKFILEAPFLLRTINPLMFLAMPFFYFFVRNTLSGENHLTKKDFVHFLPAILHVLELIPLYFMSFEEKYELVSKIVDDPMQLDILAVGLLPGIWVDFFKLFLQVVYYVFAIRLLYMSRKIMKATYPQKPIQNWLLVSVGLIGLLLFSHIIYVILNFLKLENIEIHGVLDTLATICLVLPVFLLNFYMRINHSCVHGAELKTVKSQSKVEKLDGLISGSANNVSYEQVISNSADVDALEKRIDQLFRKEKLYLQPDLTLKQFAEKMEVSERNVSQFIKIKYGKGIKEFINYHRIEEALVLMQNGYLVSRSIEGLCFSVGFRSRITFFLAFKKFTGLNPTEYLSKISNKVSVS